MLIGLGGRRLYCDLVGPEDGPVVCFAHSLSSDSGVWAEQMPPLLAAGWRVLRLDMRGHGGSDPGPGPCTMADLADDAIAALDFLGIEKAHFVGLSIGGMIGQQLGLDHPNRIVSLLLTGTSPQAVPGPPNMWPERFATMELAGSLEPLAGATMDRWFTPAFREARPGRWRQIRSIIANTSLAGYRQGAEAIIGFDLRDRLPGVRLPTLVICGDEDTGTPPAGNRLIAASIPGARYEEMASARHLPNVEHPALYNRMMLDWLTARLDD